MTRQLLSGRISGTGLISFGDNQIVQFENDVGDIFGIPKDTVLANPIMGVDSDGNITEWENADDPGDVKNGPPRFKDAAGRVGFLLWDSTNDKEVFVTLKDNYFYIYENATPGAGYPALAKFRFPLAAAAGQNLDFDFTGKSGLFLAVKSDASGIDYVTTPGLAIPTAKVYTETMGNIDDNTDTLVTLTTEEWELYDDEQWNASYPKGLKIPNADDKSGVYLITAWAKWASSAPDKSQRGIEVWQSQVRAADPALNARLYRQVELNHGLDEDFEQTVVFTQDCGYDTFISMKVYQKSGSTLELKGASLSITALALEP